MRVCGIISEYNPFHTGHAYQLAAARAAGAEKIVVVMSGQFVQRGMTACLDKWQRANAAIAAGADLVLELPVSFAAASAERFAAGGVSVLRKLGCVSMLHCGSECGDAALLRDTARNLDRLELSGWLKQGLSYPAALRRAMEEQYGEAAARLLDTPNNILAIEYQRAIDRLGGGITLYTVPRAGAAHDGAPAGGYASASWIRRTWAEKGSSAVAEYLPYTPPTGFRAENGLEQAALYRLSTLSKAGFAALPDVNEGLENRLYRAAKTADTLEGFCTAVQTRRYPLARIRRIVTAALLGIRAEERPAEPVSARVLAVAEGGYEILRSAKREKKIFCSGDTRLLSAADPYETALERRSVRLFSLAKEV